MPETALEETAASLLNRWGLVINGKPTNGALALFAKDAGKYLQFRLQMAKFRRTKSLEFIDNQQLEGNIFELLDGAMAFCFKHLNLGGKVVGLKRQEELENSL